jgi:hypothetical protein
MKRIAGWTGIGLLILAGLLVLYRRELKEWLKPDFRVTAINNSENTMVLERANHRYTVRCGETCSAFRLGGRYRMEYRGAVLEYQHRTYPILEVEVIFPTTPGGLG